MEDPKTAKVEPEPQPREWVTPTLEQVPLKEALSNPSSNQAANDGLSSSS